MVDVSFDQWRRIQMAKAPSAGGRQTAIAPLPQRDTAPPPAVIDDIDEANWYSPFQPIAPFGPPAIRSPREWDYPVGYNLQYVQPRVELMTMLRGLRSSWGVLATIIETRKDQLLRIPWTIQRKDKPRASTKFVDEMRQFFRRPDRKLSYSQWSRKLLDDLLVIDAPAIYFPRNALGRPMAAEVLDGATIFPLIDDSGRRPDSTIRLSDEGLVYLERQPAFQQIIKGLPLVDLDETQLMYVPMRPRADFPLFGYPPTEQILIEASEAVRKTVYQLNFWCYSADTEVLTRRGWLKFSETVESDEFATRNASTKKFEWQRATKKFDEYYEGEMVSLSGRHTDLLVTPNHRILLSGLPRTLGGNPQRSGETFVYAKDLVNVSLHNTGIPTTSIWEGEEVPSTRFTGVHGNSKLIEMTGTNFCAFMGMWLSEGSLRKKGAQIHQMPYSKGYTPFKDLLTEIFGKEPYYSGKAWEIGSIPLQDYLRQFGKAYEKFIPQEIMNATPAQIEIFLYFFFLGDGGDQTKILYTSSKKMAGQLVELAQKVGANASVSVDDRVGRKVDVSGGTTKHTSYGVRLRRSGDFTKDVRVTSVPNYAGRVMCVSVPNSTLYVRRNNKAIWCGNSEGTIPDLIVSVPDTWTPRQIAAFQAHFDAMLSGNLNLKSKVRFLPGGMKPFDVKNASGESLWSQRDETLIRLACYAYSVSPTPFVKQTNRSTAQNAQQTAEEEGLYPLMSYWKDDIMDPIIQEKFGYDDIEFVFQPRPEPDQEKAAKIHDMKIKNGEMSRNEARAEDGLEPIPGGNAFTIQVGNAVIPLEMAAAGHAMPALGGDGKSGDAPAHGTKGPAPVPSATPLRGPARPTHASPSPVHKLLGALLRKATPTELAAAIADAKGHLPDYSQVQLKNGNYPKGHVWIQGLNVSIENAPGSKRGEKDESGVKWEVTMLSAYGYVRGTIGADGEALDVYIGNAPDARTVWVIDQNKVSRKGKVKGFDEHKAMICYDDLEVALFDYLASHFDGHGHDRLGDVVELSMKDFKRWLRDGDLKAPIAPQAGTLILRSGALAKALDKISTATNLASRELPRKRKRGRKAAGPRWLELLAETA